MQRNLFEQEHLMFRDAVRRFVEKEVKPYHEQWEQEGIVSRAVWRKAGELGFLGIDVPERYGGGGVKDFRYNAIVLEELALAGASGIAGRRRDARGIEIRVDHGPSVLSCRLC